MVDGWHMARRGTLRKLLHGKSRPIQDVFFVNTKDAQYRVVGRNQKQPEIGDTFEGVPAMYRKNNRARRTFRVIDIDTTEIVPIYTVEA